MSDRHSNRFLPSIPRRRCFRTRSARQSEAPSQSCTFERLYGKRGTRRRGAPVAPSRQGSRRQPEKKSGVVFGVGAGSGPSRILACGRVPSLRGVHQSRPCLTPGCSGLATLAAEPERWASEVRFSRLVVRPHDASKRYLPPASSGAGGRASRSAFPRHGALRHSWEKPRKRKRSFVVFTSDRTWNGSIPRAPRLAPLGTSLDFRSSWPPLPGQFYSSARRIRSQCFVGFRARRGRRSVQATSIAQPRHIASQR
jgi:hypothetical protein